MRKLFRLVSRKKSPGELAKMQAAEFFSSNPHYHRLKALLDAQGGALVAGLQAQTVTQRYRRLVLRYASNVGKIDQVVPTDTYCGHSMYGFASTVSIRRNLQGLASTRRGELWAAACLVVPILSGQDVRPFLLIICDDQGNTAVCIHSETGLNWAEIDEPAISKVINDIAPIDEHYDARFFDDLAARLIADFPDLIKDSATAYATVADRLKKEMRILADIEASAYTHLVGQIHSDRVAANSTQADLEKKIRELQPSVALAKQLRKDFDLSRQATATARERVSRLESELRSERSEKLRQSPQVSNSESNTIRSSVDRLFGL